MMIIECEVSDGASAETTGEQLEQLMRSSNSIMNMGGSRTADVRLSSSSLHLPATDTAHLSHGQLVSANSFDMPAPGNGCGTSLSEDSGLAYTTSSVSSGDSIRGLGQLKLEMEMTESEGEVSQFDSLDNSSDGGMSAENFNTLKKGPLAPIDPPPEFQDSPQTTLLRSPVLQTFAMRITRTLLNNAIRDFVDLQQNKAPPTLPDVPMIVNTQSMSLDASPESPNRRFDVDYNQHHRHHHQHRSHVHNRNLNLHLHHSSLALYTEPMTHSDVSIRRSCASVSSESSNENIYDLPNVDSDDSNKLHIELSSTVIVTTHSQPSKITAAPRPIMITQKQHSIKPISNACEIFDYDMYYRKYNSPGTATGCGSLESAPQGFSTKIIPIYSPRHYQPISGTGSNLSTGNRPNSRNSLNSRLSSSHNSLSVPTTNKADDSIFITQAMSHDTLTGREINDFYNVPIDSDIYSMPVDMVLNTTTRGSTDISRGSEQKKIRNAVRTNKKRRKSRAAPFPPDCANQSTLTSTASSELLVGVSDFNKFGSGTDTSLKVRALRKSAAVAAAEVKRYRVPDNSCEPIHNTKDEAKLFYHSMYGSSSDCSETGGAEGLSTAGIPSVSINNNKVLVVVGKRCMPASGNSHNNNNNINGKAEGKSTSSLTQIQGPVSPSAVTTALAQQCIAKSAPNGTSKKYGGNHNRKSGATTKEMTLSPEHSSSITNVTIPTSEKYGCSKRSQFSISMSLKQKFCSIFRFRRSSASTCGISSSSVQANSGVSEPSELRLSIGRETAKRTKAANSIRLMTRALPPLPRRNDKSANDAATSEVVTTNETDTVANTVPSDLKAMDFAANIEKVKEYGWYWGPISSEAAEKILSNEPDGSFIVRDSSDDHYIFSLTFKLNNTIRHVRIEQDQGTFSFGSCAKFKSNTIMDFIENAVESSRSGRYLFFFHRRPEHGPMRVQLTNPVSRFKHIQSLQHMCRFVIRKTVVRKDLIQTLPLPRRLLDYLGYTNCFSEEVESDSSQSNDEGQGTNSDTLSVMDARATATPIFRVTPNQPTIDVNNLGNHNDNDEESMVDDTAL